MERQLKISDQVIWGALDDEIVLLNLDTGVYFSLDGLGRRFWELLSEGVALDAMLQRLNDEYEVEAAVLRIDIDSLVLQLAGEGLIVGVE
jgi:coenzyme PQQ synthesis protein D (PqqD)